jgi:XTP/dITP diphosphohydrolase
LPERSDARMDAKTQRLVLATKNPGKVLELKEILRHLPIEVVACSDYPGIPDVVEDGETFEENAIKKAQAVARATGEIALADDSGLEVDALGGRPGVHSARFREGVYSSGSERDKANYEKLLSLLEGVEEAKRTARFRCVVALSDPSWQKPSKWTPDFFCYHLKNQMPHTTISWPLLHWPHLSRLRSLPR